MKKLLFVLLLFSFPVLAWYPKEDYSYSPKCPSDKPIMSETTKECFSCDYTGSFTSRRNIGWKFQKLSDEVCAREVCFEKYVDVCSNRETFIISYFAGDIGTFASVNLLKECPSDKPFRTLDGCLSCDDLLNRRVLHVEDCSICSNRFSSKNGEHVYCALQQCPLNYFKSWNSCFSCGEAGVIRVEKQADCEVCSNREYHIGGDCTLKDVKQYMGNI